MRDEQQQRSASPILPGEVDAPAIGDWLHIEADGTLVVFTGKAEVGQNIRTSLAQAVAEELRLPIDAIRLVMADTDLTPFDMGTFGSRTTPIMAQRLRTVAAATRELLLDLAAELWAVPRNELQLSDGQVQHSRSARCAGFARLTGGRRLTEHYSEAAPTTPAGAWHIAGTSPARVEARAKVTGRHRYSPDLTRPGMLFGKLLRPPAFGATLTALDTSAAEAMPGLKVIREGELVGVAAPSRREAAQAIEAIHAEWTEPEQISTEELFEHLRTHPAPPPEPGQRGGPQLYETGSLERGRAAAEQRLARTYTHAYIAHAPLEPRAALAEWSEDRLTVWTGTQRPFGVRAELAAAFDLPEEAIRVIVPDTGSAYGGKHTGEAAIEAARLARAAQQPVKLIWTREEEFTWAYFRPAGVIEISGAARADGVLTAWEFLSYNSGAAGMETPYEVPHQRIEFRPSQAPLRQGSYRALAATANNFARETHMDELAQLLGMDPLDFRLKNLRDARLRAVLEAAAAHFGWEQRRSGPRQGVGIACGTEKGSYVATCAEVAVAPDSGEIKVARIVQAFECGAIVNPEGLRNQVEGAIVQGLGGALTEAIEFGDGRILNHRFSSYRVPRFADTPIIETILLNRTDLPAAGGGETPIIGVAPAVANAVFAASGVRLRSLPLAAGGLDPGAPLSAGV